MIRSDLAEDIGIVDECAEEIDGLNAHFARWNHSDGGVIRRVEADENVFARGCFQALEDAIENDAADFGAAPATTHGSSRRKEAHIDDFTLSRWGFEPPYVGCYHRRELLVFAHPFAIDPIFPSPNPFAFKGKWTT